MFQRFLYRLRRHGLTTSSKVYVAVVVLIVVLVGAIVFGSGSIQKNSFKTLYSHQVCIDNKQKFDVMKLPRKSPDEVKNIDLLIPVRFMNNGSGNGKYGFIDVDGSVVVEGVFDEAKRFYGGYIEMRREDYSYYYLDAHLQEFPGKTTAPLYVEGWNIDRRWQQTKTSLSRMMLPKSDFSSELIAYLEELTGLQVDYINRFSLPFRYYTVHYLSFEHPVVYAYFDEDFKQIGNQVYFNELYVDRAGVVKVDSGCGYSYLDADGEVIWQEDYLEIEEGNK